MFSFVDQITEIGGGSVRGRFAVPEHFEGARDWLMFEAIGQLAAWVAMRDSDFAKRPVGATVGAIEFAGPRRPRGVLDLTATIQRTDHRAVLYRGAVACRGAEVAAMSRCIGPLLPMETFDDPAHARARYESLTGPGPIELWSDDDCAPQALISELTVCPDGSAVAEFCVDEGAELFSDHFPRHPVVPATILIEAMCQVGAASVQRRLERSTPVPFSRIKQVKVRRFTEPGKTLLIEASPFDEGAAQPEVSVAATSDGESIASVCVICSP